MPSKKINLIYPNDGWILQKLGDQLNSRLKNATHYLPNSDFWDNRQIVDDINSINYFIHYNYMRRPTAGKNLAWFTHPEEVGFQAGRFWEVAKLVDFAICNTEKYAKVIRRMNVPAKEIVPGIDEDYNCKLKLGVIGRIYTHIDRKGKAVIEKLRKKEKVDLLLTNGKIARENLPKFYQYCDYILITSTIEGGPMSLLEALACGKKVIAPKDVGLSYKFEHEIIPYEANNYSELSAIIDDLIIAKEQFSLAVSNYTWDNWARSHTKIFEAISNG